MKIKRTLLATAIGLLAFVSCNDDNGGSPSIAGGAINGSIDGSAWATGNTVFSQTGSTVRFYGYRDNGGNNPTVIDVELKGYTGVGTYQLGDTSRHAYLLYNNVRYDAATGEVKVTQDDASWFRATFNFEAKDSTNTTMKTASGKFDYSKK